MFDDSVPAIHQLADLTAAELIDAARTCARAENAACARKLAVMAEIFIRRTQLPAGDRELWWVDPDAAVAAELAAAQNISRSMALHQTYRGVVLADRLPRVGALFEQGVISEMLVRAIVARTQLIIEDAAMAAVDADLAAEIVSWGPQSAKKTEVAIDALVERHDPGALRRGRESTVEPDVEFGSPTDIPGFTTLWARLYSTDAAMVERCLREMAQSVCDADPRSLGDRLAAAIAARFAGVALACACGRDDCPVGPPPDRPGKDLTVYVLTDAPQDRDPSDTEQVVTEPASATPETPRPALPSQTGSRAEAKPAFVFGAGFMPTPLLEKFRSGARHREIRHPGQCGPESRYTPSRALAEFVRCRDLTCRFPGCDHPATDADLDHTVPYPHGPTHPSNLKALCRFHHLLKTFWTGAQGWRDRQYPDGTVVWTSPTGHTYTTSPGSRLLFPALCRPTATLWTDGPPIIETRDDRGHAMPRRRQTRAHNRARTIAAERHLNDDLVAERNKPPPF